MTRYTLSTIFQLSWKLLLHKFDCKTCNKRCTDKIAQTAQIIVYVGRNQNFVSKLCDGWPTAHHPSQLDQLKLWSFVRCKRPYLKRFSEFYPWLTFYDHLLEKKATFKRFLRISSFLARWPRIDNSWTWESEKMSSGRFSVVLENIFLSQINVEQKLISSFFITCRRK